MFVQVFTFVSATLLFLAYHLREVDSSKTASKFVRLSLGYQIALANEFSKHSDLQIYLFVLDETKFDTKTTFTFPSNSSKAGVVLNYKTSSLDKKICGIFSVAAQETFLSVNTYQQFVPDDFESQVSSNKTGAYFVKKD